LGRIGGPVVEKLAASKLEECPKSREMDEFCLFKLAGKVQEAEKAEEAHQRKRKLENLLEGREGTGKNGKLRMADLRDIIGKEEI